MYNTLKEGKIIYVLQWYLQKKKMLVKNVHLYTHTHTHTHTHRNKGGCKREKRVGINGGRRGLPPRFFTAHLFGHTMLLAGS